MINVTSYLSCHTMFFTSFSVFLKYLYVDFMVLWLILCDGK